jgi:glycosyltransferase involved in cell wall biosynthesis
VRYVDQMNKWLPGVASDLSIGYFVNRPTANLSGPVSRVRTPPHFRCERATLGAELITRRPRLVHSPDFIAPSLIGSKRVITVHDLTFFAHPEYLSVDSLRYYRQIDRSLKAADRVIVVSDFTRKQLIERTGVPSEKVTRIWNGVETSQHDSTKAEIKSAIRRAVADEPAALLLSGRPIILSVGTIEPRKRHDILLHAIASSEFDDSTNRPLLVVVGQRGWQCECIVAEILQGVARGDVVWLLEVDDTLLDSLYRLSTVLAFPSDDEGFGLPILEAMARGLPVVASNSGAVPEVAGDAAHLIDERDADYWAHALAVIIDDPARQCEMADRGQQRAQSFSWESTAKQTADVYREVLNQ